MTMWIGVYTRVSPFTLASILYHRSSWMSSVCDKLFERKTGTPIAQVPVFQHTGGTTMVIKVIAIPDDKCIISQVRHFVKCFCQSFWKSFGEVWEKMIAAASCVCVYTRMCACMHMCTHGYIQAHVHRHPQTHELWRPFDSFSKGRWREGATGAGWWSIGLRMTPLFRPSFWPLILTPKIDRSRWRFKRGAKRRTKANEVSLKNRRHKNY